MKLGRGPPAHIGTYALPRPSEGPPILPVMRYLDSGLPRMLLVMNWLGRVVLSIGALCRRQLRFDWPGYGFWTRGRSGFDRGEVRTGWLPRCIVQDVVEVGGESRGFISENVRIPAVSESRGGRGTRDDTRLLGRQQPTAGDVRYLEAESVHGRFRREG